jgi:hypothetical protein
MGISFACSCETRTALRKVGISAQHGQRHTAPKKKRGELMAAYAYHGTITAVGGLSNKSKRRSKEAYLPNSTDAGSSRVSTRRVVVLEGKPYDGVCGSDCKALTNINV